MRDYELVNDVSKEVMRRIGKFAFGLFEVYLMITQLIPLLIAANTVLKALLLITVLIYGLLIIMTFCDVFM